MATIDTVKEVLEENLDINPESVNDDSTFDSLASTPGHGRADPADLEEKCDVDFGEPEGLKEPSAEPGRVTRAPVSRKAYRAR